MRWLAAFIFAIAAIGSAMGQEAPFVGGWRAETTILDYPAVVELVVQPNGSFSQQTQTAGSLITIWGKYRVFADQQIIRLDIENYAPKQWCGPLGCQQITMPAGETHRYSFPDRNTLVLQNTAGGAPITYRRTL